MPPEVADVVGGIGAETRRGLLFSRSASPSVDFPASLAVLVLSRNDLLLLQATCEASVPDWRRGSTGDMLAIVHERCSAGVSGMFMTVHVRSPRMCLSSTAGRSCAGCMRSTVFFVQYWVVRSRGAVLGGRGCP